MGKARGPKRKEAPARKRLQTNNPSNSALLHKPGRGSKGGGAHRMQGVVGGSSMGKRTLSQQLLAPNKRARGGKRRRKADGPPAHEPGSTETAVIQAEYAAVDARDNAKKASAEARRLRAPVRVRLAPPSSGLRMPSEGDVSMQALRASSSARMVDALLQSITDDPAPDAAPARPVRSAGRKRRGNPYAALQGDSTDDDEDSSITGKPESCTLPGQGSLAGGGVGSTSRTELVFAAPSGFAAPRVSSSAGGGDMMFSIGGGSRGGRVAPTDADDDDDPDL